jgi:hypothetical protein
VFFLHNRKRKKFKLLHTIAPAPGSFAVSRFWGCLREGTFRWIYGFNHNRQVSHTHLHGARGGSRCVCNGTCDFIWIMASAHTGIARSNRHIQKLGKVDKREKIKLRVRPVT